MATSTFNANEIYAKELEDELMKYTRRDDQNKAEPRSVNKFQEVKRQLEDVQSSKETEVNIIECTKSVHCEPVSAKSEEETERSSSFDGSDSCLEYGASCADSEVLSAFRGDSVTSQDIDMLHEKLRSRKKKPTDHWRMHIQPLSWRCKWVELQIKKLESQARVYEKELELYNRKKQPSLDEESVLIDGVKSAPFSRVDGQRKFLKRKKRRRVEEATDKAEYMLQHKFFSFYEDKKSLTDCVSKHNESRNAGKATKTADIDLCVEDELFSTNCNSDEKLLWEISSLQSQVGLLKIKLGRIRSQNIRIFACIDDLSCLSMPVSTSNPNAGDAAERTVDFTMPGNSISSHEDTVLNDTDNIALAHFAGAPKRAGDNVQVKEEVSNIIGPEKPSESKQSRIVRPITRLTVPSSSRKKRGIRRRAVSRRSRKSSS